MAIGQVIGRVSIKVLPDLTDFRKRAQRDLSRIEDQLSVNVHCTIDFNQAKRDLLQGIREINRENRELDSRKVNLRTALAADRSELRRVIREYSAMTENQRVTIRTKLSAIKATLELDQQSLDDIKHKIEHWKRQVEPVKVKVTLDLSDPALRRTDLRLSVLSRRRTVDIVPKLNNRAAATVATGLAALSGGRALHSIVKDMFEMFQNLDKSIPLIGAVGLGIVQVGGLAASAASNLFALSSSLASIGPAALLLPGLLGGIAVGVGVMVAALKDFNTVFPDVKKKLTALQDLISSSFWSKAKAPIRALIDETLPLFQAGMAKTATQLGSFFGNLATDLKTHLAPALKQMFDDLSQSINVFSQHTGSIAKVIASLGRIGSSRLPQLAGWFGDLTDRFSKFLTTAENDGRMQKWIDDAIQAIKDLGSVLGDVGSIFASIGRAAKAAGGSTLGTLADTLDRLAGAAKSVGFQKGLTQFLKAAHDGIDLLTKTAGPAFKQFLTTVSDLSVKLLPIVGKALGVAFDAIFKALSQPAVMNGVLALFKGLSNAITDLAPAMGPLGKALGAVATILGAIAGNLGAALGSALTTLSALLVDLTPHLLPLIDLLGNGLLDAVAGLAPVFKKLAPVLGELIDAGLNALVQILPVLVPLFLTLANTLADVLTQAVISIAPILPALAKAFADMLTALTPLVPILGQALVLIVPLLPQLAQAFTDLLVALIPLIPPLILLVQQVLPLLQPIIEGLIQIIPSLVTLIASLVPVINGVVFALTAILAVFGPPVVQSIVTVMTNLVNSVTKIVTGIVGVVEGVFGAIKGVITGNWKEAWDGVQQILNGALNVVKGTLQGFALGLPTLLFNAGKSLITGLANGIWDAATGLLKNTLGRVTDLIPDWKGPLPRDKTLLFGAGQAIVGGLVRGLESKYDVIRKSLRGLTDEIGATVVAPPSIGQVRAASASRGLGSVGDAAAGMDAAQKVFNYYAASGSSLGSEEDLFAAASRSRFGGF